MPKFLDDIIAVGGSKVGIGTTSPNGVLDIHAANGNWRVNDYGGMYFRNSSNATHESYIHPRSDGSLSIGRVAESNWAGSGTGTYASTTYDHLTFDTSSNATFTGSLNVNTSMSGGSPSVVIKDSGRSGSAALNYISLTDSLNATHAKIGYLSGLNTELTLENLVGNTSLVSSAQINIKSGGSQALTLDSSQNATFAGSLTIPDYINHTSDSGTKFGFSADDTFVVRTAGAERLKVDHNGQILAGWRFIAENTTTNSLFQAKYNSTNFLEIGYNFINVQGGDYTLKRSGTERIKVTASGIEVNGEVQGDTLNIDGNADISGNLVAGDTTADSHTFKGMVTFGTSFDGEDDWEDSAISIRERDLITTSSADDKYSPNLNFHWAGRHSNSLWMDAVGDLNYGEYSASGIPSRDGTFKAANITVSSTLTAGTISATNYGLASADIPNNAADTTGSAYALSGSAGTLTTAPAYNEMLYTGQMNASTSGLFAAVDNSNSIITLNRHSGNYDSQLGFSSNGEVYYRSFHNTAINTTAAWRQLVLSTSSANMTFSGIVDITNSTEATDSTGDTGALRVEGGISSAGHIYAEGFVSQMGRDETDSETAKLYPLGHYTTGKEVFSIDPTWTQQQLEDYFDLSSSQVAWATESDAPAGWSIRFDGSVGVGIDYNSGLPMIPIDDTSVYFTECWIKNVGSNQKHYMGSIEREENFASPSSGLGNPGSYGYWVMSNFNPGSSWTRVTGYITGRSDTASGNFETDANYFSPQALFNYTAGTGTRACIISGWRIIKIDKQEYFADGTAALPAITNYNDPNTGIFFEAADTINISTGGTKRLTISPTGVTSFNGHVNLDDNNHLLWGGNAIVTHTGSATNIGDNSSSSVLTLTSGNATFTGNITAAVGSFKAPDATASIINQFTCADGNNAATFRTTTSGRIFEIRSQNSGTLKFDSTSSTFTGAGTFEGILNMHDAAADLAIQGDTSGNAYYINSAGEHRFRANGSGVNSMTINSSLITLNENTNVTGTLNVGTTAPSSTNAYGTGDLNVENDTFAAIQVMSHSSTVGNYSFLGLGKSSGTGASPTISVAEETVGAIRYYGYDGNDYRTLAAISADVDGTPGDDDMPGRLEFWTTADGASSPTRRLTIGADGNATFAGNITANGNVNGDGSTNVGNMNNVTAKQLLANGASLKIGDQQSASITIGKAESEVSGVGQNDATDVVIASNLTVTKKLLIQGELETETTTNTIIKDNVIQLNDGGTSGNTKDSGIVIHRGTSQNVAIVWDEDGQTAGGAFRFIATGDTAGSADVSMTPQNELGENVIGGASALGFQDVYAAHFRAVGANSTSGFVGDGSGVTNLNMGNASSGTLAAARGGTGLTSISTLLNSNVTSVSGSSGSCTGNAATATAFSTTLGLTTVAMSFQLAANTWTDTGINSSDLATGTYAMQVYVDDHSAGGLHYDEYYSATISWYGGITNSTNHDEIVTHNAGHASNNSHLQIRTLRHANPGDNLMLQVKQNFAHSTALNGTDGKTMTFKFRRLI